MPKYEWYFVNKDDDVCKHATSDVRNSVFLNLAIVLDGLHAMVTWGCTPLSGQYGDVPLDRALSEYRI